MFKKVLFYVGWSVAYLILGMYISHIGFEAAEKTYVEREKARMQTQLGKCHGGNFCRVENDGNQYRFLTISAKKVSE